jgi:hypothetical protein
MTIVEQLRKAFDAAQSGIVLTSVEPENVVYSLAEIAQASVRADEKWELLLWDAADGLTNAAGERFSPDVGLGLDVAPKVGLHDALQIVLNAARDRQSREITGETKPEDQDLRILVIRNFDRHLCPSGSQGPVDSFILALVQKLINIGQTTNSFLVLQTTPEFELPLELAEHCEFIHHRLPDEEERAEICTSLGVDEITPGVLAATAGLSRAKVSQYAAEVLTDFGFLETSALFAKKANHLSRSSKLDVWSPQFVQQTRLWPVPDLELQHVTDVTSIAEETHATNKQLKPDELRVKIRYIENGKRVERWLDPMPKAQFESTYRPERDFYSFRSVVGLTGLKHFLRNGFRPDVPERAKMKHVLMLGVPGTGKSFTMQCCSGEFQTPLASMQASNLYSKWLGDTDKILARMLATVEMIGGILAIDEFQRFLPQGGSGGESGGVENRLLGTLLTWFNNQNSNLVLSAANNIANLPDEITRSGRVDALMFVGFPGRASKDAAWQMYLKRHELESQELPADEFWTPADIMSCCRLAELQRVPLKDAARWITPSYEKNPKQMDDLMYWAEAAGCICAETGERFKHPKNVKQTTEPRKVTRKLVNRST